jgi:hypothetical protein
MGGMELSDYTLFMLAKAGVLMVGAFIAGFMGWLR